MAGDFSRNTFDAKKHYSGVLMQQGRVQLDADWNEQLAIQHYRAHTETKDLVGACGVPKKGNSFKITASADDSNINIAPGHIYVGGLLCQLDNAANYVSQPYYPHPDSSHFANPPAIPPQSPTGSPPPPPVKKFKDGNYIVYVDAWQREVNYLDDPHIQEVALGEADTAVRLQNVWQVKLLPVANAAPACNANFPEWNNLVSAPSGMLNVQSKKTEDTQNPCVLPPQAGYQRLENQLYRVEVQRGGARANATFKWSRDNASVETAVTGVLGNVATVADLGKDDALGFEVGQWVELVDEESALTNTPGPLLKIDDIDRATREITFTVLSIPGTTGKRKLRRWDQNGTADGLPMPAAWSNLEDGVQVMFSEGMYRSGDYWLIPARTATGEVEWPPYQIPNPNPIAQPPLGIRHSYCKLALMQVQGGEITVQDCRPLFPALTEICAEDVCYDSSNCRGSGATTVQEALDELCQRREGSCTLVAIPGRGWEKIFDEIGRGQDAQVCFQVGDYPLGRPVNISNKGHLKITGCGPGTRILAPGSEAALVFSACKTVIVRDVYAETGLADYRMEYLSQQLNGTLSFVDCNTVEVSGVRLKCAMGAIRAATCITVRNKAETLGTATIQNCQLQVGHQQQGILLVNVARCYVQNNAIKTYDIAGGINWEAQIQNKQVRAALRDQLFSNTYIGKEAPRQGISYVKRQIGDLTLHLTTAKSLQKIWLRLFEENPPSENVRSQKEIYHYLKKLGDRMLLDTAFRRKYPAFRLYLASLFAQQRGVAAQGITVGGITGNEVHIQDNTIEGVLQGIHVGLSRHAESTDRLFAGGVNIANNTVRIVLHRQTGKTERHGIFVGNCKTLLVENNDIKLERLEGTANLAIDGILVWGHLGDRLMITKNYVSSADENQKNSFTIGIHVHPIQRRPVVQWLVMYNVAPSIQATVRVVNGAVDVPGTNVG